MIDRRPLMIEDREDEHSPRLAAHRCSVPGCGRIGKGKPWCADHVLSYSPYAQQVHRQVCLREAALAGSKLTEDMLADARAAVAEAGELTIKRLARLLHVSIATASNAARALVRAREARLGRTRRGSQTVRAA